MTAKQLRDSILQLAIQGKLVPQEPHDESASELLKGISKIKKQLFANGEIKKKDLENEPVAEEDMFMDLPAGWAWIRLGDLGAYRKGPFGSSLTKAMFVPKSEKSIKVYEQKNAIQKDYSLGEYYISVEKFETMKSFITKPGDIIVSCAGTIGETYLLPSEAPVGIINQALMRVQLYDDRITDYWRLFFEYIVLTNTTLKGNGSAIKNIPPFDSLKKLAVPLPPLAEQKRIVAKIEELLPIVEQYGQAQKELEELNAQLPQKLRQSILQDAIQGKLVPQLAEDEIVDFSPWITNAKIVAFKEKLIKKSELSVSGLDDEEEPFSIPDTWQWYTLSDVANMYTGDSINAEEKNAKYTNVEGICYIGTKDVAFSHSIDYHNGVFIPEQYQEKFKVARANSILLCIEGGSAGRKIGFTERDVCFGNKLCCFTPYIPIHKFLYYYLQSDLFTSVFRSNITGIIGGVSVNTLKRLPIPLPPLAEQKRIVAKIEELFAQIDKMK